MMVFTTLLDSIQAISKLRQIDKTLGLDKECNQGRKSTELGQIDSINHSYFFLQVIYHTNGIPCYTDSRDLKIVKCPIKQYLDS